jgi:hypothetical protein
VSDKGVSVTFIRFWRSLHYVETFWQNSQIMRLMKIHSYALVLFQSGCWRGRHDKPNKPIFATFCRERAKNSKKIIPTYPNLYFENGAPEVDAHQRTDERIN